MLIILVLLDHSNFAHSIIIYRFHMPLFLSKWIAMGKKKQVFIVVMICLLAIMESIFALGIYQIYQYFDFFMEYRREFINNDVFLCKKYNHVRKPNINLVLFFCN